VSVVPETGLERQITADPEWQEGAAWGEPRTITRSSCAVSPSGPIGGSADFYLRFYRADNRTADTRRDPLEWFERIMSSGSAVGVAGAAPA